MNLFIDLVIIFICISFYVLLCLFCLYHKSSSLICPTWISGRDVNHGSHGGSAHGYSSSRQQVVSTISSSVSLDMPPSYDDILSDRKETPPPSYSDLSLVPKPLVAGGAKTVPYSTDF